MAAGFRIPILYPITDRALAGGRSHAGLVAALASGGATLVQMRDKGMPDCELLAAARAATDAAHRGGARLIMNDRVDVALVAGADGVHVGSADLPAQEVRRLLLPGAILGVSTHTPQEAISAARLPVDYVALGPIFPTAHAAVMRPAVGLEGLAAAARSSRTPIVAIGGITLANAAATLEAGAACLAVMGDLMTARDIAGRVAEYLRLIA